MHWQLCRMLSRALTEVKRRIYIRIKRSRRNIRAHRCRGAAAPELLRGSRQSPNNGKPANSMDRYNEIRMKPRLITALWAGLAVICTGVSAQTPITSGSQSQAATTSTAPTSTPARSSNSRAWPAPATVDGQPIERRQPEKSDDQPAFPEQTRAPYHASAAYQVTTLIDNLPAPWSLAFLPDGKILFTERLPGSLRILDSKGTAKPALSEP